MPDLDPLKNKYKNEQVFLVGNGPSLNETPLNKLKSEYTFAMGNINYIYSDTGWRPSFYMTTWDTELERSPYNHYNTNGKNFIEENISHGAITFLSQNYKNLIEPHENLYFIDGKSNRLLKTEFDELNLEEIENMNFEELMKYWSDDIKETIYWVHSMYGALQILSYMGFDEIYLIGCDLGLKYKDPHMIFENALDPYRGDWDSKISYLKDAIYDRSLIKSGINAVVMEIIYSRYRNLLKKVYSPTINEHFDSEYEYSLRIHDGERVEQEILKGYTCSKKILNNKGIDIYNATVGGNLELFERKSVEEVL